jgi:hypothetical protein
VSQARPVKNLLPALEHTSRKNPARISGKILCSAGNLSLPQRANRTLPKRMSSSRKLLSSKLSLSPLPSRLADWGSMSTDYITWQNQRAYTQNSYPSPVSHVPNEQIRTKNATIPAAKCRYARGIYFVADFVGCPPGIRTPITCSRGRCPSR